MGEPETVEPTRRPLGISEVLLMVILPLLVLGGGVYLTKFLLESGPHADRKPRPRRALLVRVEPAHKETLPTRMEAMGTVVPSREIMLHPRVAGQVVEVREEFVPGGIFHAGDPILQIDPSDFKLRVRTSQSEVARVEADVQMEKGMQSVARREYELLGRNLEGKDEELVLRKPQLEAVEARLEAAKASLEQAKLDLERTVVKAPFNAIVRKRGVNVGSQVSTSTEIATLAGVDEYWIEASVPLDRLKWIRIPRSMEEEGSEAEIRLASGRDPGAPRKGRVIRLLGELEERGRMARIVIAVGDPLNLSGDSSDRPRLLLDSYVHVYLDGGELKDVVRLDRRVLRNGDRVWVMVDGKLQERPVHVAFRERDSVLIDRGLEEGDRVVVSDIPAPVEGMLLRTGADPGNGPRPGE